MTEQKAFQSPFETWLEFTEALPYALECYSHKELPALYYDLLYGNTSNSEHPDILIIEYLLSKEGLNHQDGYEDFINMILLNNDDTYTREHVNKLIDTFKKSGKVDLSDLFFLKNFLDCDNSFMDFYEPTKQDNFIYDILRDSMRISACIIDAIAKHIPDLKVDTYGINWSQCNVDECLNTFNAILKTETIVNDSRKELSELSIGVILMNSTYLRSKYTSNKRKRHD